MGWVAAVLTLTGMYLVGDKRRCGFLVCVLSEILWIFYALSMGSYELVSLCIVFTWVYARNWIRWGHAD